MENLKLNSNSTSEFNGAVDEANNLSGIPLLSWMTLIGVLYLISFVVPSSLIAKSKAFFGTLAFFSVIPVWIGYTIYVIVRIDTVPMLGLGLFEILLLLLIWAILMVRSCMLYKSSRSWKSFIFGNEALLAVKHETGTSYFPGAIAANGLSMSVGMPKGGHGQVATTSGLYYFPCLTLKASPETVLYMRPTKVVLLKRENQAIMSSSDVETPGSSGVLFYKPVKTLNTEQIALWHGEKKEDLTSIIE